MSREYFMFDVKEIIIKKNCILLKIEILLNINIEINNYDMELSLNIKTVEC
jgi:hypothetical protein